MPPKVQIRMLLKPKAKSLPTPKAKTMPRRDRPPKKLVARRWLYYDELKEFCKWSTYCVDEWAKDPRTKKFTNPETGKTLYLVYIMNYYGN